MRPFVRPEAGRLASVLLLSIAAVLAGLSQPYLTKELIDGGVLARDAEAILRVGTLMVWLAVSALVLGLACRRLYTLASLRILHRMKEALFAHLLTLPPGFFASMRQGDLMTRLEGDLGELQRFAVDSVLSAINSVLTLVGTALLLGSLSPTLMLMLAALLIVNGLASWLIRPRLEVLSRRVRQAGVEVSSFLVERVGAVKCLQTHNAEAREGERLADLHEALRRETLALQLIGQLGGSLPNLLLSLGVIGIFVGGSLAILRGEALTLGILVAFASCVQRANAPVQSLMGLYLAWQRAKVAMERISELLSLRAEVQSRGRVQGGRLRGELEIRDLGFRHPGSTKATFAGFSCRIAGGSQVLLRGDSGCGKSTVVDLLHRHFDPARGAILLDGVDLREFDRTWLRSQVAVVSQEATLFSGTLAENILYGRPSASPEEMERAAEAAGVTEFLPRLAHGFETQVGPRGGTLSGGQRQRIALARALLMQPAVLVIDEGTSSLDEALELRSLRRIAALLPGCTRIVVSHRAGLQAGFDQVIEFPVSRLEVLP